MKPPHTFWLLVFLLAVLVCIALSGCAALPQFMQPNDAVSQEAEGGWLVLDAVDTLQTIQIAKHARCFHEADGIAAKVYGTDHPTVGKVVSINIALALAHTMVASWLDDEVDKHATDGTVGPWYSARVVFETVSLGYSGYAVMQNSFNGLRPWGVVGCP